MADIEKTAEDIMEDNARIKVSHDELSNAQAKLKETAITDEELNDRMSRINNIIVHGLPESEKSDYQERRKEDHAKIQNILINVLDISNTEVLETVRLGQPAKSISQQQKPRPLQIVLPSQYLKRKVLRAAGNLSKHPKYSNVSLKDDRTPFQREQMRYLVKKVKEKQEESDAKGEEVVWRIRGYKIVQIKESQKAPTSY